MKRDLLIKKMCLIAMFSALSYVLAYVANLLHLSITLPFLTYDPKDVIICIAGFSLGPIYGVIASIVVSLLEMVTFSSTGYYGLIMNVISTCALVLPSSLIYKYKKNIKGAILALIIGFISAIIVMALWNIIITPLYMDMERKVLIKDYLGGIMLFNVIKVGVNVAFIFILYKPITRILKSIHLLKLNVESKGNIKTTLVMLLIGFILLIILIIVWILIKKYS